MVKSLTVVQRLLQQGNLLVKHIHDPGDGLLSGCYFIKEFGNFISIPVQIMFSSPISG